MWDLMDLVWPRSCVSCGAPGPDCCSACRAAMLNVGPLRVWPENRAEAMPPTWAGTRYGGSAATVIVGWKDDDRPRLGAPLLPLLARAVRCAVEESPSWQHRLAERPAWVVPVPSRPAGTRGRGRYPVRDLVVDLLPPTQQWARPLTALAVSSSVRDQAGLGRQARARNLAGSMRVRDRHRAALCGAPVVLVDDVVTTGATLAEAVRALSLCDVGPVIAATLAAAERHTDSG